MNKPVLIAFIILFGSKLFAAVPVGVLPFEGEYTDKGKIEMKIKDILVKTDGISVVADSMMESIVKIHESAQTIGSAYHDMSKLKIAAFIITGNISGNILTIKAIDVNEGVEIQSASIDIKKEGSQYALKRTLNELTDRIILAASGKGGEVPGEAAPYMEIINALASSLGRGDESSYPYIAIYLSGAYRHPDPENKKSIEVASRMLKIMRQDMLRAKISFVNMKTESFWIYIDTVADKLGRKTKIRFGILELDDGSLGIGIYEPDK